MSRGGRPGGVPGASRGRPGASRGVPGRCGGVRASRNVTGVPGALFRLFRHGGCVFGIRACWFFPGLLYIFTTTSFSVRIVFHEFLVAASVLGTRFNRGSAETYRPRNSCAPALAPATAGESISQFRNDYTNGLRSEYFAKSRHRFQISFLLVFSYPYKWSDSPPTKPSAFYYATHCSVFGPQFFAILTLGNF